MAKKYPLAVVLSVTTGVVLVGDLALPNIMLDDMSCPTWHQGQESILLQHPQLKEVDASKVSGANREEWLAEQVKKYGAELEVEPLR